MLKPPFMKKHLLLLLLSAALLGSTRSTAQPYQSIFGKDSTMWSIEVACFGISQHPEHHKTTYTVSINGNNYWKVIIGEYGGYPPRDSFYLRENTMSGLVWFLYPPFDSADHLLMDFSLNLGDT